MSSSGSEALRREPRGPFDDVVRHTRVLSLLPGLDDDGALTSEWTSWLMSMDETLERAEAAARKQSISLSLAFRGLREELNQAVTGDGPHLRVDVETVEALTIRAARLATTVPRG